MIKLLSKCVLLLLLAISVFMVKVSFTVKKIDLETIPKNNLSNSSCLRAKLDHAVKNGRLKQCTFLISGSSTCLNNISGQVIQDRTGENVYNISAWGAKPAQSVKLLEFGSYKKSPIKCILVAFDNDDFGKNDYTMEPGIEKYIAGNVLNRAWIFFSTFNINIFLNDWNFRTEYSYKNNMYQSLKFDETGSVQLERKGFVIDKGRWESHHDTTGFNIFYKDMIRFNELCSTQGIRLVLAYLPTRQDLLTESNKSENLSVSKTLKHTFGQSLINLNTMKIPDYMYCDGTHLFKEGSDFITNKIVDSLQSSTKSSNAALQ